jgi:Flp pilus assembly pilin Flp
MGGPSLPQHRIKDMSRALLGLMADQSGATAVEYTLIVVLVVMALITGIGDFVSTPFQTIAGKL